MKAGDAAIISKNPGILEASRHQNFRVASEAGVLSVAGHIRSAIQLRKNRHLRRPSRSAQEQGDFRRDDQVEVAFDLVSTAGARALGIGDYGITAGSAATLFTIAVSCVAEAVAAHPARKLVLFDGKIVARDGTFLAAPIRIASEAMT
jgi:cytosine/adenosine deaminase-related metal-dependent hydrolase